MNTINTLLAELVFTCYTHVLLKSQPGKKLKNVKNSKSDFLFFGRLIFAGRSYRAWSFKNYIICIQRSLFYWIHLVFSRVNNSIWEHIEMQWPQLHTTLFYFWDSFGDLAVALTFAYGGSQEWSMTAECSQHLSCFHFETVICCY